MHGLILAGGRGSRFFPLSDQKKPKQFLDVLSKGKTLLQSTYERLAMGIPPENIWVITHQSHVHWVLEQLPYLDKKQVLAEPEQKNTAASILYACHMIQNLHGDVQILVSPSDHYVVDEGAFWRDIALGMSALRQRPGLMVVGQKPAYANTQYGYICLSSDQTEAGLSLVRHFVEKPPLEKALEFVQSGAYVWNTGLCLGTTGLMLEAFAQWQPLMYRTMSDHRLTLTEKYAKMPTISMDYAILEHQQPLYALVADAWAWSDLGTWDAVYAWTPKDDNNNVIKGDHVVLTGVSGCLIYNTTGRPLCLAGLTDSIVIQHPDVLMITPRHRPESVQAFAQSVEAMQR